MVWWFVVFVLKHGPRQNNDCEELFSLRIMYFPKERDSSMLYIGIDFGNGEIKAAACDAAGRPEAIRTDRGAKSWPSYLYKGPEGLVLGEDAREMRGFQRDKVASGWKMKL